MAREQLRGRHGQRTAIRARDDSRMLASFRTSPLEPGPLGSRSILREREMGRKGARTRSRESVPDQSWCRAPDASHTTDQNQRLTLAWRRCFSVAHMPPGRLLAQTAPLSQAERPMNSSGRPQTCVRVFVAALLFAAFSWTLLVSVSPRLHGSIHDDANRIDHVCAISLIASGSYEHSSHAPLISTPQFNVRFAAKAELTSTWVKPLFLRAHLFAHAPPALHL
jgi:hypothetical protein